MQDVVPLRSEIYNLKHVTKILGLNFSNSAVNTFQYNGEDLRTQKVDSGGAKNYVCDGTSPASAVLTDGAAVYTPGLSERRGSASKFLYGHAYWEEDSHA